MTSSQSARRMAVVGGGWAGCAAAVELAGNGIHVSLFEAARTLGGRARCVEINGRKLDNGQHILLGAYSETLGLMRRLGIREEQALLRLPLQMRYPPGSGGMEFMASRMPAPLHLMLALFRARGLGRDDKLALARFSTSARWMDWRLDNDCTVAELLARFDQTEALTALMWRPLCIAALNTPPQRASAQVFLNVLRDSLGARRSASDMLLPRLDLTMLLPGAAEAWVGQRGGAVEYGRAVRAIARDGSKWRVDSDQGFDAVIVATSPSAASALLQGFTDTRLFDALEYEPITTCYLQYARELMLDQPFYALVDDGAGNEWGQFIFDRGQLDQGHAGLLSVVISASADAIAMGHESLATAVAAQLAKALRRPELAVPEWSQVISEKRATYSCRPGLQRPPNATGIPGLAVAGDYTASDYPATLESAVRSGLAAARSITAQW